MKYVKNLPGTDEGLSQALRDKSWTMIKEPRRVTSLMMAALPFALLNAWIYLFLLANLNPEGGLHLRTETFSFSISINFIEIILGLAACYMFMVLHEFIHALLIPNAFQSDKTVWGLNAMYGFVSTREAMKKGRFLLISILPFVCLSLILPVILHLTGHLSGFMIFLCLINALGSCVDVMNIVLVAFQVPRGRWVITNGFETYYSPSRSMKST